MLFMLPPRWIFLQKHKGSIFSIKVVCWLWWTKTGRVIVLFCCHPQVTEEWMGLLWKQCRKKSTPQRREQIRREGRIKENNVKQHRTDSTSLHGKSFSAVQKSATLSIRGCHKNNGFREFKKHNPSVSGFSSSCCTLKQHDENPECPQKSSWNVFLLAEGTKVSVN